VTYLFGYENSGSVRYIYCVDNAIIAEKRGIYVKRSGL